MCGNSGNCGPKKVCTLKITNPEQLRGMISPVQFASAAADYYRKGLHDGDQAVVLVDNFADRVLLLDPEQWTQFEADVAAGVLAGV